MSFEPEMRFFIKMIQNLNLNLYLIDPSDTNLPNFDLGLRQLIYSKEDCLNFTRNYLALTSRQNIIYHIRDIFMCNYICFRLPLPTEHRLIIIGPYTNMEIPRQAIRDCTAALKIPPQHFPQLEKYYSDLPLIHDENMLFSIVNTFGETLWNSLEHFSIEYIQQPVSDQFEPFTAKPYPEIPEEPFLSMQILEDRYRQEALLLQAVSQGLLPKMEHLLTSSMFTSMEQRVTDPIRNFKNYMIVLNTLLRKGAEAGSVHPLYLDEISSKFARKIETITSLKAGQDLQRDMLRKYCLLVKNHSMKGYSDPVVKVLTYIDFDLTADLSLNTLAKKLNVNSSYLSSLFRKETGNTLTDHVSRKRVEHALLLLNSSNMQVQTIAEYCGVSDVNYFTKMFKKYIGKTPKEYRKDFAGFTPSR